MCIRDSPVDTELYTCVCRSLDTELYTCVCRSLDTELYTCVCRSLDTRPGLVLDNFQSAKDFPVIGFQWLRVARNVLEI